MRKPRGEPILDINLRRREVAEDLAGGGGVGFGKQGQDHGHAREIGRGEARHAGEEVLAGGVQAAAAPQQKGAEREEYRDEVIEALRYPPPDSGLEGHVSHNDSHSRDRA